MCIRHIMHRSMHHGILDLRQSLGFWISSLLQFCLEHCNVSQAFLAMIGFFNKKTLHTFPDFQLPKHAFHIVQAKSITTAFMKLVAPHKGHRENIRSTKINLITCFKHKPIYPTFPPMRANLPYQLL